MIEPIKQLYEEGYSCQEIKDKLNVPVDVRSIQRLIKKMGISRTSKEAYRNAIKRGRVTWVYRINPNKIKRHKLSPKLRYTILLRDGFKCVKCGSNTLLEVDHIDENKNNSIPSNLQTLCHICNQGKSLLHRFK